ncbi:MAG: hypothetical protein K6T65_16480, partial [Peptococcaceae bacterium]|nr:hypothetical protein [Peptococcaceae bacterium]
LNPDTAREIIEEKYKPMAGNPKKVVVLNKDEVKALVDACVQVDLDKSFLEKAYQDIADFRADQMAR